jgi:hypothetical protein
VGRDGGRLLRLPARRKRAESRALRAAVQFQRPHQSRSRQRLAKQTQAREFNFALGAYRVASEAANTARWNGEIPVDSKDDYRDPALPAEFWKECLATDPTSNTRNPPSLRAPNGVLEDSF